MRLKRELRSIIKTERQYIKVDKIISSSQFRRVQMRLVKEQKKITSNSKHESLFSNEYDL